MKLKDDSFRIRRREVKPAWLTNHVNLLNPFSQSDRVEVKVEVKVKV